MSYPSPAPWHSIRHKILRFVDQTNLHAEDDLPDCEILESGLMAALDDEHIRVDREGWVHVTKLGWIHVFEEMQPRQKIEPRQSITNSVLRGDRAIDLLRDGTIELVTKEEHDEAIRAREDDRPISHYPYGRFST